MSLSLENRGREMFLFIFERNVLQYFDKCMHYSYFAVLKRLRYLRPNTVRFY